MLKELLLETREYWAYNKLKLKLSQKEIKNMSFVVTNNSFSYMEKSKENEIKGETWRFPGSLFLLFYSLKYLFSKEEVEFKRTKSKGVDMMFVGPGIPGEEAYIYSLQINPIR